MINLRKETAFSSTFILRDLASLHEFADHGFPNKEHNMRCSYTF